MGCLFYFTVTSDSLTNKKYKVAFALLNQDNQVVYSYLDNNTDLSVWIKGYPTSYEFTPKLHGVKKGTYTWAVALVDTTRISEGSLGRDIQPLNIASIAFGCID